MTMPGFAAEAALPATSGRPAAAGPRWPPGGGAVHPALISPGCIAACRYDCRDQCGADSACYNACYVWCAYLCTFEPTQ